MAPIWRNFRTAAASGGHFNPLPDDDGVTRRVPMLAEYEGAYYESLSMAMVRLGLGSPPGRARISEAKVLVKLSRTGMDRHRLGAHSRGCPGHGAGALSRSSRAVSSMFPPPTCCMARHRSPTLKNRIVLVGTTAPGLFDLRAAPVASVYPGVEIHANLIAGMLDGNIKQKPPYVLGAEVVLLLFSGLAMALVLPLVNPLRATRADRSGARGGVRQQCAGMDRGQPGAAPGLGPADDRDAVRAQHVLRLLRGVARQAPDHRAVRPVCPARTGRRNEQGSRSHSRWKAKAGSLSVLFTDVRGFTTISEGLDPKQLSKLMNEFLTPLTRDNLQASRHHRQVHGRLHHGLLGSPAR